MNDSEFSDFTKLVLARLETNPDEFQLGGRWDTLVRGLEAYAIDETENRYHRTLWPLTDHERTTILEAYRKAYLARLHKDMLKNIVSGNDLGPSPEQTFQTGLGKQASQGVLRGTSPSTVLTTSAMAVQAKSVLDSEFNKAYTDAFSNAIVKGEGQMVQMADTNTAYKYVAKEQREKLKKVLVTHTDHVMAKKMGMIVQEYIKRRDAL
jgi:uncharacterized surface protein with fasciclin (FAS1) repeats